MALHVFDDDPLLTDQEAAADLGICERTLRRWDELGTAPALIRVGRKRYRRRSTIRQWLIAQEGQP